MRAYNQKRLEKLIDIFEKFPNISNRMTAKILFRDYPEFFKNEEMARDLVRLYRGAKGEQNKGSVKLKKYFR